jgi:hypothetical protein
MPRISAAVLRKAYPEPQHANESNRRLRERGATVSTPEKERKAQEQTDVATAAKSEKAEKLEARVLEKMDEVLEHGLERAEQVTFYMNEVGWNRLDERIKEFTSGTY